MMDIVRRQLGEHLVEFRKKKNKKKTLLLIQQGWAEPKDETPSACVIALLLV